jgi:tRNA-2-methylthio-N6-dimethylallyladenosine synthase
MMRRIVPHLAASTDVIVGFPGETDDDFERTLDVMAQARFDNAFMFQFSPRPGTPAADLSDQIDHAVVQERFNRLVALQNEITFERNRDQVGWVGSVMVEGPSKRDPMVATTRTRGNRIVHVPGEWAGGSMFDVSITRAAPHYLVGEPIS